MMKKKGLLFMQSAVAMLLLSGCQSETAERPADEQRLMSSEPVVFAPQLVTTSDWNASHALQQSATRSRLEGDPVTGALSTSKTFRVSGFRYNPQRGESVSDVLAPNFLDNAKVSYNGMWKASGEYYIPLEDERTLFYGWLTSDGSAGVTPSASQVGGLKLDYQVPLASADAADKGAVNTASVVRHPDLLTAVSAPDAFSDAPTHVVPLEFSHQLTEVNFVAGPDLSPGTIEEIAFTNVCMGGTLSVGSGTSGTWEHTSVPAETVFTVDFATRTAEGARRTGETILGGLMMIPQQFSNANQTIRVQMSVDGSSYTVFASLQSSGNWTAGQPVTYQVSSTTLPQLLTSHLTLSANEVSMHKDGSKKVTVTENLSGGVLSAESSNPAVATASVDDGKVTVNGIGVGTATITVTSQETDLYTSASQEIEVTVERGILLSAASSPHIGKVVCSKGYIHDNVANVDCGGTACAMIAYFSSTGHGLAAALSDASESRVLWANAASAVSSWANGKSISGGVWRLPSANDWKYIFQGCGGSTFSSGLYQMIPYSYGNFRNMMTACGGTDIKMPFYWTSTEVGSGIGWRYGFDVSCFGHDRPNDNGFVRAVFAF